MQKYFRYVCIVLGAFLCITALLINWNMQKFKQKNKLLHKENYNVVSDALNDGETRTLVLNKSTKNKDVNSKEKEKQKDKDKEKNSSNQREDIKENNEIIQIDDSLDWCTVLINRKNLLSEDNNIDLKKLSNGIKVDSRICDITERLMRDAYAQGVSIIVASGYRTYDYQKKLYNDEIKECMARGYAQIDAMEEAAKAVTLPGASEHQAGLAIDVVTNKHTTLDEKFDQTKAFDWLKENAHNYGFILRYPKGKEQITGIIYEPWHYRYVGVELANYLRDNNLTMEEYYQNLIQ